VYQLLVYLGLLYRMWSETVYTKCKLVLSGIVYILYMLQTCLISQCVPM